MKVKARCLKVERQKPLPVIYREVTLDCGYRLDILVEEALIVEVKVENNSSCPLVEYGQLDCYDIGSGGSVAFADLSLVIPTDLGPDLVYQVGGERGPVGRELSADLVLHQDSSGTSAWDTYLTLTDWNDNPLDTHPRLQSYITFRGYRTKLGGGTVHTLTLPQLHPLFAATPPAWYVESGAFGPTALPDRTAWPNHEDYIRHQLDTAPTYKEWMDWYPNLVDAIERADFAGSFDYGDWPIDYEGYGVAPLNAKYDNDYGAWLQWARAGDPRWFDLAEALDRHVADIDILHNLHNPRHWGDGIAFGHSYHDEDGFLNPHRNYGGNHPDTAFGMRGLLLTYYLTGYEKAHESAMELADCIEHRLHNDGHLCDHFPDCSGEGYGLGESGGLYETGSRPAANGLSIAVAAYRAAGDPRYLAVADALVDWAQPENQPYIDGPTGEAQMMRPWMLNLYLRALIDYLEMRDEFGLPDTYGAADAFLAYADWLRTYPWLDLDAADTGPRAAYPYEWWFDGRQGDPSDEWSAGNNIPSVNNWLLLGADTMAYAYLLSGDADYLERATALFRTGSRDPWFEGDDNTYSSTKETANSITFGHIFLHTWAQAR